MAPGTVASDWASLAQLRGVPRDASASCVRVIEESAWDINPCDRNSPGKRCEGFPVEKTEPWNRPRARCGLAYGTYFGQSPEQEQLNQ
jgi:hypothetical protein